MDEERQQRLREILSKMWEESRPQTLERVRELEEAVASIGNHSWNEARRASSESMAHKLAGALGTYGLRDASMAAREVEVCFAEDSYNIPRLKTLLERVRAAVEN